jgi:hypothetical protein
MRQRASAQAPQHRFHILNDAGWCSSKKREAFAPGKLPPSCVRSKHTLATTRRRCSVQIRGNGSSRVQSEPHKIYPFV